jgi:hypothetical protein
VFAQALEHGGNPDPVLEKNAGDLDEIARAAVLVVGVCHEFVDCVAEFVKHCL